MSNRAHSKGRGKKDARWGRRKSHAAEKELGEKGGGCTEVYIFSSERKMRDYVLNE